MARICRASAVSAGVAVATIRSGAGRIAAVPAIINAKVASLALDPPELPERLLERRLTLAILRVVLRE
jgi:hypothetical protein